MGQEPNNVVARRFNEANHCCPWSGLEISPPVDTPSDVAVPAGISMANEPAEASNKPVWLVCFSILGTVNLISLLLHTNTQDILTLRSKLMKMRLTKF